MNHDRLSAASKERTLSQGPWGNRERIAGLAITPVRLRGAFQGPFERQDSSLALLEDEGAPPTTRETSPRSVNGSFTDSSKENEPCSSAPARPSRAMPSGPRRGHKAGFESLHRPGRGAGKG